MGPRNQGLQAAQNMGAARAEGPAEAGAIMRLTLHAKRILAEARNTDDRIESLSVRLFGGGIPVDAQKDAPEPIRSDVEELEHVLGMLEGAVASGSDRLKRLEQL